MNYPRLLVLSNNSFSKSNSNGRTLGSLLKEWPKDRIAQFCISSDGADFDVCNNYYCVTDNDVLKATLHLSPCRYQPLKPNVSINANSDTNGHVRHRKTTLKMFARNIAWMLGFWKGNDFNEWIDNFKPDIILLQNGESFFMHNLALNLAKKTKAKLAIFNTEGYYFFKKDYFPADNSFSRRFLFPIYQKIYRHCFRKFMKQCKGQIYGNELLKNDYDNEFSNTNSLVIYTGSDLEFTPSSIDIDNPSFNYLGNLGFDRPKALIEFANSINSINPNYKLDVYGFAKDKAMEQELNNCPSIRFHGAIAYSQVLEIIKNSDFLLHVECQSNKWAESLKYGFSTKIADSISSGKIFILYSSPGIACAQYIQNNGAGIYASNINDLKKQIFNVINSTDAQKIIQQQARIAAKNHNPLSNISLMKEYLINLNSN